MYRGPWIAVAAVVVALVAIVGIGAYAAGSHWDDRGERVVRVVETQGQETGSTPVVRIVEPERYYHHGGGFFPGIILFPLLLFGLFWLVFGAFGRRGGWHRGRYDGPSSFEEWHRRQHANDQQPPAGNRPSGS